MFALPLWVLLTASLLQLIPELRGMWMFDPSTGAEEFVSYGIVSQWFRGGIVSAVGIAFLSPLFGLVLLIASGVRAVGMRLDQNDTDRYQEGVGNPSIRVPVVVRKRKRSGAVEDAVAIRVAPASSLRRFLARSIDWTLLGFAFYGGAALGLAGTSFTSDWGEVAWIFPGLAAFCGALAVSFIQWSFVGDRGQTFGKMVVDIRTEAMSAGLPRWNLGVLRRSALPQSLAAVIAAVAAAGCGEIVIAVFRAAELDELFVLSAVRMLSVLASWPVLFAGLELMAGVPVLFGREQSLYDRVARTRVVRTAFGPLPTSSVPLGFRLVARGVDLLLTLLVGAPILFAVWNGGESVSLGGGIGVAVGISVVLVLAVTFAQWTILSRTGATLGKRLVGLRVEREGGAPVGFRDAVLVRELIGVLALWSIVVGAIGDVLSALSSDGLALHDRIAHTRVVWADSDASAPSTDVLH